VKATHCSARYHARTAVEQPAMDYSTCLVLRRFRHAAWICQPSDRRECRHTSPIPRRLSGVCRKQAGFLAPGSSLAGPSRSRR